MHRRHIGRKGSRVAGVVGFHDAVAGHGCGAVPRVDGLPWLTVSSVVACKHHLPDTGFDDDMGYLFTPCYLPKRLSWNAQDQERELECTISHVVRLEIAKLRVYEAALRALPDCQIEWDWLIRPG